MRDPENGIDAKMAGCGRAPHSYVIAPSSDQSKHATYEGIMPALKIGRAHV